MTDAPTPLTGHYTLNCEEPDYGWRSHPAIRMWMGYVPALTLYGLAMVDEWVSRGHQDSTGHQILEFAPEVLDEPDVAMPPWLGDLAFHLSHQSNLVHKAPGIYRNRFPGVPEDLAYVWPEPAKELLPSDPEGNRLWVWRARTHPPEGTAGLLMPPEPLGGRSGGNGNASSRPSRNRLPTAIQWR